MGNPFGCPSFLDNTFTLAANTGGNPLGSLAAKDTRLPQDISFELVKMDNGTKSCFSKPDGIQQPSKRPCNEKAGKRKLAMSGFTVEQCQEFLDSCLKDSHLTHLECHQRYVDCTTTGGL